MNVCLALAVGALIGTGACAFYISVYSYIDDAFIFVMIYSLKIYHCVKIVNNFWVFLNHPS